MRTKPNAPKSVPGGPVGSMAPGVAISPRATLAWGRIPSHIKTEIIKAMEQPVPSGDADAKIVELGAQVLKVRNMASGFRVIYEPGADCNTIVSVMTPRETRMAKG